MKEFFLETDRLGFALWSMEDINDALELWGNPNVTKYIVGNGKMTKDDIHKRLDIEIKNYKEYKIQYWPIYYRETNENIGCCGLRNYDIENNILEIGVHLKEKSWGRGFAKEACLATIDYAFEILRVSAIFAGHNPKNIVSSRLLKSLGFKYTHDEFYPPTGLKHPSYLLKKEEYKK
ncbi:GNAT family N-acetyltransferase [Clostridium sp. SHJSY1]|uniref:GNAT family N-acetyltransferase n=1 Tax=Clostridium sp. SHJSY1 TaxID=2942483 RepID=UPI0028766477|nr:GNAT family N-acetyltransferase [Clostridium sp. SHJSY1]MDS0526161.1 GNAT family N-acetyltransferase [Clostridium sp. SHJSY1]